MTGITNTGIRTFGLLIPVVITAGEIDPKPVQYDTIHLLPVTYKIERDWQDGLIDGPRGMLEALIAHLVFEPYEVVEALVSPDTERFRREFAMHLPATIANALTAGEYPAPAGYDAQLAAGYAAPHEDYADDEDTWEDTMARGPTPRPRPRPMPQATRAAPRQDMPDANVRLADAGPDESMGTFEQQSRTNQAFEDRRVPPDPLAEARAMVSDLSSPEAIERQPVSQAPPRAQPPVSGRGLPDRPPTARDPFVASTAQPERRSVPIRQPTGQQGQSQAHQPALSPGFVRPQAPPGGFERSSPRVDPRTGREAVYDPQNGYVPEMGAEGVSAIQGEPRADFGIGDVQD